jgi:cysteine desulfurase/selenocysteine lyase
MSEPPKKTLDANLLRQDFPILNQTIHRQKPLVYFDNGASTQRPNSVIDAMDQCYRETYANVHRGIHWLSEQASAQYEEARLKVAGFINAPFPEAVIFTSGTTMAINLVANSWGRSNLKPGDEILLTICEHHSNIVPWQQVADQTGAKVQFGDITDSGLLDMDDLRGKLSDKTKMVAFMAVSNMLGTIFPVDEIIALAKSVGAATLIDAAQHVPHEPTDVQQWDADFVVFSGHKILGPSGIGILWGRKELLESMPPFLGGGSMIDKVTTDGFTPGELPAKFEAGTPPIVEAIGLGVAIDYISSVSLDAVASHEKVLSAALMKRLEKIDGMTVWGPVVEHRSGIVSFTIEGVAAQDLAILLDQKGFAIRVGHHCAMPLHQRLGIKASCRASFYLYNTLEEVEAFADALEAVVKRLR